LKDQLDDKDQQLESFQKDTYECHTQMLDNAQKNEERVQDLKKECKEEVDKLEQDSNDEKKKLLKQLSSKFKETG
jgi:hypothetical protein